MEAFPALTHVAITVRDLSVSTPWYGALFDAEPVIDEDTDPDMHHTVYLLGNTLIGLHQHQSPAPKESFSEFRVGLDHIAFGCANRDELEKWSARLDELRRRARQDQGRVVRLRTELPRSRWHCPRALRSRQLTPHAALAHRLRARRRVRSARLQA